MTREPIELVEEEIEPIMRSLFFIGATWMRTPLNAILPYIPHWRPQLPSKKCGRNGVDAIWPNIALERVHASIIPCCYPDTGQNTEFLSPKREGRGAVRQPVVTSISRPRSDVTSQIKNGNPGNVRGVFLPCRLETRTKNSRTPDGEPGQKGSATTDVHSPIPVRDGFVPRSAWLIVAFPIRQNAASTTHAVKSS